VVEAGAPRVQSSRVVTQRVTSGSHFHGHGHAASQNVFFGHGYHQSVSQFRYTSPFTTLPVYVGSERLISERVISVEKVVVPTEKVVEIERVVVPTERVVEVQKVVVPHAKTERVIQVEKVTKPVTTTTTTVTTEKVVNKHAAPVIKVEKVQKKHH
jgi:hypothetical protein